MSDLQGMKCEATIWFETSIFAVTSKRPCGKPAKALRGIRKIPVCGTHLRSNSIYPYKDDPQ